LFTCRFNTAETHELPDNLGTFASTAALNGVWHLSALTRSRVGGDVAVALQLFAASCAELLLFVLEASQDCPVPIIGDVAAEPAKVAVTLFRPLRELLRGSG
jgi:hypothetical protein